MAGYNSYNFNPYNIYNPYQDLKNMRDGIDKTLQQHQQMQNQFQNQMMPQQQQIPQINQNFQLSPIQNNSDITAKIVSDIDEVKNTFVMNTGLFVNKEMNTLWTKNVNGDIKTYTLTEVIEIDPKDVEINNLKQELENMRTLITNQIKQQAPVIDNQPEIKTETKSEKKSK